MRHAGGAGSGPARDRSSPLLWRGWSRPAARARQGASLALVGTLLTLGGATTQARTTLALPDPIAAAPSGGPIAPIAGWSAFCARTPGDCAVDAREPETIPLTPAVWRTLRSVNARVNRRLKPITDRAHWDVLDSWDYPDDGFGDCEDYQLLKRRMLAERGLPRRALLMTVVIDDIQEGHAVLTVRTDRGDFVLDNKTDAIRPWRRTGYRFLKRQAQDGGTDWTALDEAVGDARVATAEP